jgi:hypothetical protein
VRLVHIEVELLTSRSIVVGYTNEQTPPDAESSIPNSLRPGSYIGTYTSSHLLMSVD